MYDEIKKEIETQIKVYQTDNNRIISDYEKEQETSKEYNGRQILELLQNADDEKSEEVLIKLDTQNQILEICNKGDNCNPFSIKGIKSLMLANFSPKKTEKNRKNYIGYKGLGFRAVINWSELITIYSNNLKINFSYEISRLVYKEKTGNDISKIAFLALPKIERITYQDWTTKIVIKYKNEFLDEILKQLNNFKDEVLLFVNHIEKLIIDIDGNQKIIERIKDNNKVYLKDTIWTIYEYEKNNLLPKEFWENEDPEYFDLKIADKENLNENERYLLYSFFPTEVNIGFPFIIHGTFELDSSRNNIIDSKKNRYILDKLVDFIVDTAKKLTKDKVDYRALEFLTHNSDNERLRRLEFYKKINEKINELEIFPCLDNTYKKRNEVIFISDEFSEFIEKNNFQKFFPNMLISSKNSFVNPDDYDLSKEIDLDLLDKVSKEIKNLDTRDEFVYLLEKYFKDKNYKFKVLIDEDGEIISEDEEAYTPITKDFNFNIPDFVNIKFINKKLYKRLLEKFEINSDEKARDLQRKLKTITNIHSYEPAQVLQKIITTANKVLKNAHKKETKEEIIKKMIISLYENYKNLGDKTKIPEDTRIQLLDKNKSLQNAKDLFLSISYPSGELTEFLFGDVFDESQFLVEKDFFGFDDDEMGEVEKFFLWLGVNKHTKFEKIKKKIYSYEDGYYNFLFKKRIEEPNNCSQITFEMRRIAFLEKIKNIDIEKFILWILKDEDIKFELSKTYEVRYIKSGGYIEHYLTSDAPSYILYQLYQTNIFKDYLITNNKELSKLVNDININFESEIFKKYGIKKADIESLILKLGAVEKFEDMSIERIMEILRNLETKSPDGKLTQTIYKEVRKHKGKLNDRSIKLCARKNNKLGYYNQSEVYYASSVKLPKKISSNIPLINIPPRLGKVIDFFGIKDTKDIKLSLIDYKENKKLTEELQDFLSQIQPYILVIRFNNDLKEEKTKDQEAKKLKKSKIILCNNVVYKLNLNGKEEENELDDNDYINDNNKYYIKIGSNEFNNIRKNLDFRETFADIIGSIFNITDVEKYERLISDDIDETEKIIKRKYGNEALEEARKYLGIDNEFLDFWKTIYELKGKSFNDKYKIEYIKKELNITIDLSELDYQDLSSNTSCEILQKLFKELGINIDDFNKNSSYLRIDFTEFHKRNLENCFNDNYKTFEKILYKWCLDNDKKEKFLDLKGKYENANKEVENVLDMNYQEFVEKFVKGNFGFSLKDEQSNIDFEKIYNENRSKFTTEEFDSLDNEDKSLLYFENGYKEIKEKLQKFNQNEEDIRNNFIDETIPEF